MRLLYLFFIGYTLAVSSSGYAPYKVACPSNNTLIRAADSISEEESEWLQQRHIKTNAAIQAYLDRVGVDFSESLFGTNSQNMTFNLTQYGNASQTSDSINIALAFSGGGLRAMLSGAGQLAALDNRTADAEEQGLGGILQSSSYIAGLSGGGWLLSSLIYQEWPTIDEVVLENPYNIWNYQSWSAWINFSNPFGLVYAIVANLYSSAIKYVAWWNKPANHGIQIDVDAKQSAGFNVSVTDIWGRLLAHQLFRQGSDNWLDSATWSDIRDKRGFADHQMPFPIVTALARRPNSLVYDLNSPIIEFNPFELGSFDTSINTFHDIKYIGTDVADGVPTTGSCTAGFDNAAFITGTTSSLFNEFLSTLVCSDCSTLPSFAKYFVGKFLEKMSKNLQDIAWYKPNPFYASSHANSTSIVTSDTLYLMDGGLAGEIVPLSTIATKERALDLVFSFDNDGPQWPNGSSIINTYERQFLYEGKSTICPYVPGQGTFLHHNLTAKPTFFGCDAKNLTALEKDGVVPPIVIYIANRPYEFYSNTSTLKITYSDNEKKGMVANGFDVASRGNSSAAPDWQFCVGCAMIRRAEERNGVQQSDGCQKCFDEYCWDGSVYEGDDYTTIPPYFTEDGITNTPVPLDTEDSYIHETSVSAVSLLGRAFALLKKIF